MYIAVYYRRKSRGFSLYCCSPVGGGKNKITRRVCFTTQHEHSGVELKHKVAGCRHGSESVFHSPLQGSVRRLQQLGPEEIAAPPPQT